MALTVLRCVAGRPNIFNYNFQLLRSLSTKALIETLLNKDESGGKTQVPLKNKTFEELNLNVAGSLSAHDAVNILQSLRGSQMKGDITPSAYINDEKFTKVCDAFKSGCQRVSSDKLVRGLRCLLELNLPPDSILVQTIENEVLWKSRKMSLRNLLLCIDFHKNFQETPQQQKVFQSLLTNITRRWIEIESAVEIIIILRNSNIFEETLVAKIEDRILEIADKLQVDEIISLLKTLSQARRRPTPVLRALSYYLVQKQKELTLSQCCDLYFYLTSLTFVDPNLLNKLGLDAIKGLQTTNSRSDVISVITSLSLLRWDDFELLDQCCHWLESNASQCRKRDWVSLIQSLAHLNYQPENSETLYPLILTSLNSSNGEGEAELSSSVWLDTVWSLAILGKVTLQQLTSVLDPAFYKSLISEEIQNNILNKLKIQNIHAAARVEFPLAKLPLVEGLGSIEVPLSEGDKKLRMAVIAALETFLPPPKYLESNIQTGLGFVIVGEFVVDENSKPVRIIDYGVKAGLQKELKALPTGCKRIALVVWGFKDLTTKKSGVCGLHALAARLLTKLGYTVVGIPYMEFQSLKTTVKQVMYIQEKVKEVISQKGK